MPKGHSPKPPPQRPNQLKALVQAELVHPTVLKALRLVSPRYKKVAFQQIVHAFETHHGQAAIHTLPNGPVYEVITPKLLLKNSSPTETSQGINRRLLEKAEETAHPRFHEPQIDRQELFTLFNALRSRNLLSAPVLAVLKKTRFSEDAKMQVSLAYEKLASGKNHSKPIRPEQVIAAADFMPYKSNCLKATDFFDYFWENFRGRLKSFDPIKKKTKPFPLPTRWSFDKENSMYVTGVYTQIEGSPYFIKAKVLFRLDPNNYIESEEMRLDNVLILDGRGHPTKEKIFSARVLLDSVNQFLDGELKQAYLSQKKKKIEEHEKWMEERRK